jgi:hypothetical protein
MEKQEVQEVIDNFVMKNSANFERVSKENTGLYDALIGAVNFLSLKYGTQGEEVVPELTLSEPQAEIVPIVEETPIIVEETPEIVQTEESLSEEDLKSAIKSLKPLAAFDDELKEELNRLQEELKALKKKK